tara:strand:+ start:7654 stop:8619 length:966 start_codon:yes stop_codon:yes gene_type:complete
MSYLLETNTDNSKVIHLNSKDADLLYQEGHTTYCSFVLKNPISIQKEHSALISLTSCIVPYSFYNISANKNNRIVFRLTASGNENSILLPDGNYTITTLATYIKNALNKALPGPNPFPWTAALNGTYAISFDRTTMKYTFTSTVQEVQMKFELADTAFVELGFNRNTTTSVIGSTGIVSENVCDVNGSVHSLFVRTNLTSKASIDSQTKSFSTILGKIPIQTNFGGILFFNPRDNIHKILLDTHLINEITIRLTDEENRLINLNGLHFNLSILIDIVNKKRYEPNEIRRMKELHIEKIEQERDKKPENRGRPRKPGRPKGS